MDDITTGIMDDITTGLMDDITTGLMDDITTGLMDDITTGLMDDITTEGPELLIASNVKLINIESGASELDLNFVKCKQISTSVASTTEPIGQFSHCTTQHFLALPSYLVLQ